MKRWSLCFLIGTVAAVFALLGLACQRSPPTALPSSKLQGSVANNQPLANPGGEAATVSTRGSVALTGEFFKPQGTNNQSCASCHIPEEAWSISSTLGS